LTLRDLLKDSRKKIDVTEDDVRHIFKSIVAGLSYLHSLSIAHRDIKLDNIVISEDLQEVKFIDFGLCMDLGTVEDGLSKEFCGTLSYLPPEIIQAQPH
jgi:serine/threonine protein kinase